MIPHRLTIWMGIFWLFHRHFPGEICSTHVRSIANVLMSFSRQYHWNLITNWYLYEWESSDPLYVKKESFHPVLTPSHREWSSDLPGGALGTFYSCSEKKTSTPPSLSQLLENLTALLSLAWEKGNLLANCNSPLKRRNFDPPPLIRTKIQMPSNFFFADFQYILGGCRCSLSMTYDLGKKIGMKYDLWIRYRYDLGRKISMKYDLIRKL